LYNQTAFEQDSVSSKIFCQTEKERKEKMMERLANLERRENKKL
jgi:hypothetical protein